MLTHHSLTKALCCCTVLLAAATATATAECVRACVHLLHIYPLLQAADFYSLAGGQR